MVALATIGACFGVLALVVLVLFFPHFMKMQEQLMKMQYELAKMKEDFADGLREMQENAAMPDETGMWIPRTDPVTQGLSYAKQRERAAQVPVGSSGLNELGDEFEEWLSREGAN